MHAASDESVRDWERGLLVKAGLAYIYLARYGSEYVSGHYTYLYFFFVDNGVDGEAFLSLVEEELKELVPSIGERRKLINRQKKLKVRHGVHACDVTVYFVLREMCNEFRQICEKFTSRRGSALLRATRVLSALEAIT